MALMPAAVKSASVCRAVGQHVPDREREHHDEQQRDDAGEGDGDA